MVDTELFAKVIDALPHPDQVQLIFLGDLYQLPPVYGRAVLGFKLLELPVVELIHVYRQALLSPIIRLAHKIKNGEPIPFTDRQIEDCGKDGIVTIHPWKKRLSPNDALKGAQAFFKDLVKKNQFDPEEDVVLCPYNVEFGTEELNRAIAQQYGDNISAEVYEVIAGFRKHYLAVGDRVLYDREDCRIIKINRNMGYIGKSTQPASKTLDRWGTEHNNAAARLKRAEEDSATNVDALLDALVSSTEEKQERSQAASHVITLIRLEDEEEFSINQAGEINDILFSYALTVHKAQGSEWNRVFVVLHQQHSKMVQRELLYTAVTRAKRELYVICEPDRGDVPGTLTKGSRSAKIRGVSLKDKIEFFAGIQEQREFELAKTMEADRLKQSLLDPAWARVRIHQERVEELVTTAADKLADKFKRQRPVFEIGWKLMGATAGLARYQRQGSHQLLLNPIYLFAAEEQFLAETPLHELAHIFAWEWHKDRGHGHWWSYYMNELGLTPKQYHQWGKAAPILKQLIEVSGTEKHLMDGENDA
jgi:predicted SprT family Zn-dependent metalloprotease